MSDAAARRDAAQYDQLIDSTVPTSLVSAVGFGGRLSNVSQDVQRDEEILPQAQIDVGSRPVVGEIRGAEHQHRFDISCGLGIDGAFVVDDQAGDRVQLNPASNR